MFSVLIQGEWGVGKTYLVEKILNGKDKFYYVSLYGVQDIAEIHGALFSQMCPKRNKFNIFADRFSSFNPSGLGFQIPIGSLMKGVSSYLGKDLNNDKPIVFDDLERCSLPMIDILGVINSYVEKNEFKVFVISNINEIIENKEADFKRNREKIFGMTLNVVPDINGFFDDFISKINSTQSELFLNLHRDYIIDIFSDSKINSLRVLRSSLLDLCRFYSIIRINNEVELLKNIVGLFFAISLEVKDGKLDRASISGRLSHWVASYLSSSQSENVVSNAANSFLISHRKYNSVNLADNCLDDEILIDCFFNGNYDSDIINLSISQKITSKTEIKTVAWKEFYSYLASNDGKIMNVIISLKKEFQEMPKKNIGYLLHLMSIIFFLKDIGEINDSFQEIVLKCKIYIDKLKANDELEAEYTSRDPYDEGVYNAFEGSSYIIREGYKKHFEEVISYIKEKRRDLLNDVINKVASGIIELMSTDLDKFEKCLSIKNANEISFPYDPILHKVNVDNFLTAWLSMPSAKWEDISRILLRRYESGFLYQSHILGPELDWVDSLLNKFRGKIAQAQGVNRFFLERAYPKKLELEILDYQAHQKRRSETDHN